MMAHPGFGHLWQQPDMADTDIVFAVSCEDTAPAGSSADLGRQQQTVLQRFPGHSPIISLSPYFVAQVQRWVPQHQDDASATGSSSDAAGSSNQQAKRLCRTNQVHITLPDASYEPAALAVLAGLYQVKPWSELFDGLTHQQQVQAAVLADMWQLPAAASAALQLLNAAMGSADAVTAVREQLLAMAAVPGCLQALLEQALLDAYGHLEAVWRPDAASSALQASLLALPLPAMELLLASDKLRVASEDNVLYTAQAYVDAQPAGDARQAAKNTLAPLVRCPDLSQFWLSVSVLADDAGERLLGGLQPQLKRLLLLNRSPVATLDVATIKKRIPDVPASWLLPSRQLLPASSAELEWQLDVASIKQTAQDSARRHKNTVLSSDSILVGGVRWRLKLQCVWDASKQGCMVGMFMGAAPPGLPPGAVGYCTATLKCAGFVGLKKSTRPFVESLGKGHTDFFGTGFMAGGFDEGVWAAKGLPPSGNIVLKLIVHDADL